MTTQQKIKMLMIQGGGKGTHQELATLLGISKPSIVNKLKGKQEFKVGEIRLFAKAYNLTPEQICDTFIWR
jgi:transcriptional regulator with XRE-family HTH domain